MTCLCLCCFIQWVCHTELLLTCTVAQAGCKLHIPAGGAFTQVVGWVDPVGPHRGPWLRMCDGGRGSMVHLPVHCSRTEQRLPPAASHGLEPQQVNSCHVVGMAGAWEGSLLLLPLTSHQGLQHMGPGCCYHNTYLDSGDYSTRGPAEMVVIWGTSIRWRHVH